MIRKLTVFQIIFIILFSVSLSARTDEIKKLEKNQGIIDQGKNLDQKINRLATVFVDYIANRILNFTEEDWKTFKIKEKKLYLLILFNRLGKGSKFNLDEFRNPLRMEIYKRLAIAMGWAIESKKELIKRIEILHFDVNKLTEIIGSTGKSAIDRAYRSQLGLLKAENAVYEVFLSAHQKEGTIAVGGKIVTIETGNEVAFSGIYRLKAPSLINKYPDNRTDSSNVALKKVVPQNVKIKKLKAAKIYYQAPGTNQTIEIDSNSTVQSGGKIWFELILPKPGGYLLGYLKDSHGRAYNLFPGTRNAITNGDYRVPYNLDNPYTEIQKTAAENTIGQNLPADKILIGGYTFDEKPGIESFSFYYTAKPYSSLEDMVKKAQNIGEDMPRMKGVLTDSISTFNADVVMTDPAFYHNALTLRFEHK